MPFCRSRIGVGVEEKKEIHIISGFLVCPPLFYEGINAWFCQKGDKVHLNQTLSNKIFKKGWLCIDVAHVIMVVEEPVEEVKIMSGGNLEIFASMFRKNSVHGSCVKKRAWSDLWWQLELVGRNMVIMENNLSKKVANSTAVASSRGWRREGRTCNESVI